MLVDKKLAPAVLKGISKRRRVNVNVDRLVGRSLNAYWDGGSRDHWFSVSVEDGRRGVNGVVPQRTSPWAPESQPVTAEPGLMLVNCGVFCGKPALPFVYLHPSDVAWFVSHAWPHGLSKDTPVEILADRYAELGLSDAEQLCRDAMRVMQTV